MNLKIRAFTLLEVTIAMLISAICVSICYVVFGIISKSFIDFKNKQQHTYTIQTLKSVLEKDVYKSHLAFKSSDTLNLISKDINISYFFGDQEIIRFANSKSDTLKINYSALKFEFEGQTIYDSDTIDAVSFVVEFSGDKQAVLQVNKRYAASDLY